MILTLIVNRVPIGWVLFVRKIAYSLLLFPRQRLLLSKYNSIFLHSQRGKIQTSRKTKFFQFSFSDFFYSNMNSSSSLSILNSYYDTIIEDLVSSYSTETVNNLYLQKILSHFKTVLNYNISDGKKLRGTTVIDTIRVISSKSNDELLLKQAAILGWCIELMQGSFLIADDLMDHSLTRRGKPCWYLNVKEKEWAINDAYYLFSCTLTLLNKYFPTNFKLFHLFHEVFQRTVIGQG
jgi:hypothetical protein